MENADSELIHAAEQGRLDDVKKALGAGARVEAKNTVRALIHKACAPMGLSYNPVVYMYCKGSISTHALIYGPSASLTYRARYLYTPYNI